MVGGSSILAAALAYFGRNLGFLFIGWVKGMERRQAIRQEIRDEETLLQASIAVLVARRDAPKTPRKRRQELNEDIAELERLFADRLKNRLGK